MCHVRSTADNDQKRAVALSREYETAKPSPALAREGRVRYKLYKLGFTQFDLQKLLRREAVIDTGMRAPPLGPLGFECSQHRRTPRPSAERTRRKALLPFGSQYRGTSLIRKFNPLRATIVPWA